MTLFERWSRRTASRLPSGIAAIRASRAWARIQDKPSTITITREGVLLDPQTVRIEYFLGIQERDAQNRIGNVGKQIAIIYGVLDHAASDDAEDPILDTDLKRGDRFYLDNKEFIIYDIVTTHGEIQARAEAVV